MSVNNITSSTRPVKATNIEEVSQPFKRNEKMKDFKKVKLLPSFFKVFDNNSSHSYDGKVPVRLD